jgi:hypothetical protein
LSLAPPEAGEPASLVTPPEGIDAPPFSPVAPLAEDPPLLVAPLAAGLPPEATGAPPKPVAVWPAAAPPAPLAVSPLLEAQPPTKATARVLMPRTEYRLVMMRPFRISRLSSSRRGIRAVFREVEVGVSAGGRRAQGGTEQSEPNALDASASEDLPDSLYPREI